MTSDSPATLADRLAAALDREERRARFVLSDYARHEPSWETLNTGVVLLGDELLLTGDGPLADHIAYQDPDRTLRRVAAHRRILDVWRKADAKRYENAEDEARAWLMDEVLEWLAEGYDVTAEADR